MSESRQEEWVELEAKALRMLENPRLLSDDAATKHFLPVLHLWVAPGFTPSIHWVIYNPRLQIDPQPKPLIKQIIWDRQADFKRLYDPMTGLKEGFHTEPTFVTQIAEIEKDQLNDISAELANISITPFVRDETLGLDGEHFGVETLGSYHATKIFWWSSYPEDWKELVDWFEKTRHFLQKKFNESI